MSVAGSRPTTFAGRGNLVDHVVRRKHNTALRIHDDARTGGAHLLLQLLRNVEELAKERVLVERIVLANLAMNRAVEHCRSDFAHERRERRNVPWPRAGHLPRRGADHEKRKQDSDANDVATRYCKHVLRNPSVLVQRVEAPAAHLPLMAMRLTFVTSASVRGSLTVNSPFLNDALTLSSSTPSTGMRRSNRP